MPAADITGRFTFSALAAPGGGVSMDAWLLGWAVLSCKSIKRSRNSVGVVEGHSVAQSGAGHVMELMVFEVVACRYS